MMDEPSTAADLAYDAILRDLLERAWPVDARLKSTELAGRYGQASGAVREALIRLAAQGFVWSYPQLGFRTIKGTTRSVSEHAGLRVAVEVEAARLSILYGDLAWEADLTA
ncbi:MAG: GntR family transcriptional regulator, partial [Pseudomonadota bacterium]